MEIEENLSFAYFGLEDFNKTGLCRAKYIIIESLLNCRLSEEELWIKVKMVIRYLSESTYFEDYTLDRDNVNEKDLQEYQFTTLNILNKIENEQGEFDLF